MRLPGLFLVSLLIVAGLSIFFNVRRVVKVARVPPPLEQTTSLATFEKQINNITDPSDLRRLALRDHGILLSADQAVRSAYAAVADITRSDLIQSSVILLLVLCVYVFESGRER